MIYPTDLTNSQWQAIKLLLPVKIGQRKRKDSIRAIINGILYVVKGGISWRMMPTDLPDWRLVYYYFRQWAKQGLVQKIQDQWVTNVRKRVGRALQAWGSLLASPLKLCR